MSLRDRRDISWLGMELRLHQASTEIVYLADHGWQVALSNPGGSLCIHACEGDEKWPADGGPSLYVTLQKAISQAEAEGWW